MTEYRLISEPQADLDVEAVFEWYENERAGLGLEFFDALRATYNRIADAPLKYQELRGGNRAPEESGPGIGYTDYFIGDVFTLDVATRQPRDRLPLTSSLITDAATSPDGHFIYVAIAYYPSRLAVIDNVSHTLIDTVGLPSYVLALTVSHNGSRVYAISSTDTVDWTQSDTVVSVVDTSSRAVRRLASLSGRAGRVALTHDDESLLVPLTDTESSVARIDATTGALMGSTPAGKEPVAIALAVTPGATGTSGCGIACHPRSGAIWILPFLSLVFICGRTIFCPVRDE